MEYILFYTGLASTPNSVGLKCLTNNEIICQISTAMPSGKETRRKYHKMMNILKLKYNNLIN